MSTADWVFDGLVVLTLLWLAHGVLTVRDLMHAALLFVSFGLFMALAWVRLRAPDVALAEAAIGSGLTGALLIDAIRELGRDDTHAVSGGRLRQRTVAALLLLPGAALVWAVQALERPTAGLSPAVADALSQSGVSHPVTAVLLNFRAYDTLLEITVLLLAAIGVWAIGGVRTAGELWSTASGVARGTVERSLARVGGPLAIVVAGYVLWAGGHQPGGGFPAAAILAGAALVTLFAGELRAVDPAGWRIRALLAGGVLLFLAVGLGAMVGGSFLELRPPAAKLLILLIETGFTLSVAAILVILFLGPSSASPTRGER